MIETNVIHAAHGAPACSGCCSSARRCIYPRDCPQPIREDVPAHRAARAHQRALRDRQDRRHQAVRGATTASTARDYHQRDADQPLRPGRQLRPRRTSHVLPALIRKAPRGQGCAATRERGRSGARGTPRREFLHVDDLADACVFLMERGYAGARSLQRRHRRGRHHPRAGRTGHGAWSGFDGAAATSTPPSPTARRASCSTVERLSALGWRARIALPVGLRTTYAAFCNETAVAA